VRCQASGSSRGTLTLTGGNAYDKGDVDKAAQYAFAHIQGWDMCRLELAQDELTVEWEVLVPEGHLSLCLEIGRGLAMRRAICLNLKKLHGTPSLFESLHYIRKGQRLKVSSNK